MAYKFNPFTGTLDDVGEANGTATVISSTAAQALGATAAAGSTGEAADAGHVHPLTGVVASNTTGITGSDAITNMVSLTQAEYDAIVSPNVTTLYIITN